MRQKREASNKNRTKGLDEGQGKSDRRRSRSRERGQTGQDKSRGQKQDTSSRKKTGKITEQEREVISVSEEREKRI
jgi:hypothetical protein